MARLRRSRFLSCFYCGGRTSTVYDGRVRQFECPSCEATNYLDKVGRLLAIGHSPSAGTYGN